MATQKASIEYQLKTSPGSQKYEEKVKLKLNVDWKGGNETGRQFGTRWLLW